MFFTILTQPLANGLILFYKLLGQNLGLAIIGFSVFLRLILNPLTKPYMESMKKMKEFAPQLEKLKNKYKGDRVKFAQAQADFYKEKKINPGAGCLPYLLQIVILIAFFNVFTRTLSAGGDVTMRFNEVLYEPLKFTSGQVVNTKFLYFWDVAKPDVIKLSFLPFGIPGPIILLAAIVQFWSSKLMSPVLGQEQKVAKSTTDSKDDMQVAMQKSMTYTFPLMTIVFGMSFPSGLALYWFLFSFWQLMQQMGTSGNNQFKALFNRFKFGKIRG